MTNEPQSLAEIVGQPCVRHLKAYADACQAANLKGERAASKCWLLTGSTGTGKSSSAIALSHELGCHDEFTGRWRFGCAELSVEKARDLFDGTLRLRYGSTSGFKCLILEELEWISPQCSRLLKMTLDPLGKLLPNLCVVATSNDISGLDDALLSRFKHMPYSDGQHFAQACQAKLLKLWQEQTGLDEPPAGSSIWGWDIRGKKVTFDMRQALSSLQDALDQHLLESAA